MPDGVDPQAPRAADAVVLPDGRVLPALPNAAHLPSIHAESLREHGARVYHFVPGERPVIELPERYRGPDDETAGAPPITLAAWTPEASPSTTSNAALPNGLNREVQGFLPYWMLDTPSMQYLRYDRLSTIAYFSVDARSDGYLIKSGSGWSGWNSSAMTNVINSAHARGVKVLLTVTMMAWDGGTGQATLLGSSTYRARLVQEIVSAVRLRNADGVNLDFEPVYTSEREEYTSFVRQLKAGLVNAGVGSYLSVCTMAGAATWATGYDVAGLTAPGAANHLFVMGYDYSWSGSHRAGGVAPMESSYMLDVVSSVDDHLRVVSPSKLIWGVPYYGRSWPTTSNVLNAPTRPDTATSYTRAWYYTAGLEAAAVYGRRWDPYGQVPWFANWDDANSTWREGYYDDATSLGRKYDFFNARGLAGTGMWHLLMDESRPELWELLRAKFADPHPFAASRAPAPGATGVGIGSPVIVRFSEPVTGVHSGTFVLRQEATGAVVPATVTYDSRTWTATLWPTAALATSRVYKAAVSESIRDASGNSVPWTAWRFTTASSAGAQAISPARQVTFLPGRYTGYRFTSTGAITASRTASLDRPSAAPATARGYVPTQSGVWLYISSGIWSGYWVRESPSTYLPGTVGTQSFNRTVSFDAGSYRGYRYDANGTVVASKPYRLSSASSAMATQRAVINGRPHLYIANGVWAGYWMPEGTGVHLL